VQLREGLGAQTTKHLAMVGLKSSGPRTAKACAQPINPAVATAHNKQLVRVLDKKQHLTYIILLSK